ncbi:MAG: Uma2 family endonuclease [Planctomycetota bacterium]
MSTMLTERTRPPVPSRRLLTCADVVALPESLPTGDVRYELDNGRLVIMAPPGDLHGAIQLNIGYELKRQGELAGHGKARTEVGIVLWRDPDRLVGADAAFVAKSSLPLKVTSEGYLETIPDLVVEIRSRNDTVAELMAKADDYVSAGVRVVWLIDPMSRTVLEYRGSSEPQRLGENDLLDAGDIIPGFRLLVADVLQP